MQIRSTSQRIRRRWLTINRRIVLRDCFHAWRRKSVIAFRFQENNHNFTFSTQNLLAARERILNGIYAKAIFNGLWFYYSTHSYPSTSIGKLAQTFIYFSFSGVRPRIVENGSDSCEGNGMYSMTRKDKSFITHVLKRNEAEKLKTMKRRTM